MSKPKKPTTDELLHAMAGTLESINQKLEADKQPTAPAPEQNNVNEINVSESCACGKCAPVGKEGLKKMAADMEFQLDNAPEVAAIGLGFKLEKSDPLSDNSFVNLGFYDKDQNAIAGVKIPAFSMMAIIDKMRHTYAEQMLKALEGSVQSPLIKSVVAGMIKDVGKSN